MKMLPSLERALRHKQVEGIRISRREGGSAMSIRDFAERYIEASKEAWQKGIFEELERLSHHDVVYHYMPLGRDMVGWEAFKEHIVGGRQALPGLWQEWQYLTSEGNYFAISYKSRGMFTGRAPGMPPPTGKEVTANYLYLFHLKDGKIAEAWYNGTTTGLNFTEAKAET
jgi:predicted ester cyclase